nr:hypothetical protein [Tanacetum cinerariifolium]
QPDRPAGDHAGGGVPEPGVLRPARPVPRCAASQGIDHAGRAQRAVLRARSGGGARAGIGDVRGGGAEALGTELLALPVFPILEATAMTRSL